MLVSCDPGFTGGLALLDEAGIVVEVVDMPIIIINKAGKRVFDDETGEVSQKVNHRTELDLYGAVRKLEEWRIVFRPSRFLIERVGARPEQGLQSTFEFGYGAGVIAGIAAALGMDVRKVDPNRWKPAMACTKDKRLSCERERVLFPAAADRFKLVKHNGRAEAAMIGLYGVRKPELWS